MDGKALPEATVKLLRLTLTKDRYKTERGNETLFDSSYMLDASQSPSHIDILGTEGDLKSLSEEATSGSTGYQPVPLVWTFFEGGGVTRSVLVCTEPGIPTGFRLQAQGCEERATLGKSPGWTTTPNGVASGIEPENGDA